MLARHLDRCPTCSAFAASVVMFTSELRAAPLAAPECDVQTAFGAARRRQRMTLRLPLVGLTAAAAAVLMTSVALREKPVSTALPSASPQVAVGAGAADEQSVLRQLRTVVHARQLQPDYRPDTPGMYLG